MKVAVYVRVSNGNQSPEMQLQELHQYAARRGWEIVEYTDRGHCGARESRPALDRLMADARKRLVDAVVVYRYDRFARSVSHLIPVSTYSATSHSRRWQCWRSSRNCIAGDWPLPLVLTRA